MSRPTLVSFNTEQTGSDVLIPADFGAPADQTRQLAGTQTGLNDAAVNAPFGGDASQFGTFTWDSQTNEVSMDSAMSRMLGNPSPMIGARLKDFMAAVSTADRERVASTLRESLSNGRDFREEMDLATRGDQTLKVRMIGKIVTDLAGQPKTAVCAVHPLAPLCDSEALAEQPEPGRDMAQICHDLRSPIGAILGYAQLLLNDSLPDQTRSYIQKINRNCEQLLETINNSLQEARKGALGRSAEADFSAADVVNDVGEMFAVSGIKPTIDFDFSDADPWTRVTADRLKVRRVLINLVDNALKFTDSGQVTVSGHITRDADAQAHMLLSVTDTGCGLDDKAIRRVFDPFYQNAAGAEREGVGLGLSICQNLSRAMGGELSATSEPGKGSCFKLRVPVEVVGVNEADAEPTRRRPLTALVVGAENAHNRGIVEALNAQGCGVRWTDRADAEGTDQPCSSVALVDCSHEAAAIAQIQSLRRHSPELALVAVCERMSESHGQRLLDAGATTLLVKPFLEQDLIATVDQAISEQQHAPVDVPETLADPMVQAARKADIDGLNGLIDDLEAIDRELAQDFKAMASRMDYDSVLESLKFDKTGKN